MTEEDLIKLLISLTSGLLGGVIVAILNHVFTKRRTEAEIAKLVAQTELLKLQAQQLVEQLQHTTQTIGAVEVRLGERILYNGRCDPVDFTSRGDRRWDITDVAKGEGTLTIQNGILNVERTNTEGRFAIYLRTYFDGPTFKDYLPRNPFLTGTRALKLTCKIKVVGGRHTLVFVIKSTKGGGAELDFAEGKWLGSHKQIFTKNEWTDVTASFRIPPDQDCFLRIDDQDLSEPGSVQLRELILTEMLPPAALD